MKQFQKFCLGIAAVAAVLAAVVGETPRAAAQAYPNKLVRLVVPFSAGSITDGLARILADKLTGMWKQQVIVENRPGLPGTTSVAKSAADGYTLMLTSNGHTIAGVLNKNIQFDPVKDFAGVSRVASVPLVANRPAQFAGQDAEGIHRVGEGETGSTQLLFRRRRQHLVPVGRDFPAERQYQHGPRALQGCAGSGHGSRAR